MKNHESRPTGATPFPEANVVFLNNINGRGRGRNRGRGRDRGRGRSNYTLHGNNYLDFKKLQMMIIEGRLHKIRKLKVVKINASVVV